MSECQDVPGHMGWLNCPTHNREIMAKIQTLHAGPEQTTRDQSNPHASHCSCKYEVDKLNHEKAFLEQTVKALELQAVLQQQLVTATADVVEAARGVRTAAQAMSQTPGGNNSAWKLVLDQHRRATAALFDSLYALDKATEAQT